jgi:hypothetical protein
MGFQLVGEVIIDGRKGTVVLKELQREASRTSGVFRQAGHSTEKLGKSLLQLGLNAGSAHSSLHSLHRLGAAGLFAGAFAAGINKFGEAVKKSSEDYYQSRKSLNEAFEQSFKSTTVEDAQAGIKKTEDTIESLRGKIAQMGAFKSILSGMEKITGFSFGVADTEKSLKDAQDNLAVQEKILDIRKQEAGQIKKNQEAIKVVERISAINKIDIKTNKLKGNIIDENVSMALEELQTINTIIKSQQNLYKELTSINKALQNNEAIEKVSNDLADSRVKKAQVEYNLIKATKDLKDKQFKQAQEAGGGILGASKAGRQSLETAQKARARSNKSEDFKTQEKILEDIKSAENIERRRRGLPPTTKQDLINRLATQQAAGEMPSLADQLVGAQKNASASQIAAERATGDNGKNLQDQLLKAIEDLSKKLPAAVAQ